MNNKVISLSQLLQSKRFLPLLLTQCCMSVNSNLLRNLIVVLTTPVLIKNTSETEVVLVLAFALFTVPFLLFSTWGGFLADRFNKTTLIRIYMMVDLMIMIMVAIGLWEQSTLILSFSLILLGSTLALFGPPRLAILPDHLPENALIAANALLHAGTFLALFIGTLIVFTSDNTFIHANIVALAAIAVGLMGVIASFFIPNTEAADQNAKMSFHYFHETKKVFQFARLNKGVYLAILGVTWFWFVIIVLQTQLPTFIHRILSADSAAEILFLGVFSVGIIVGSLFSYRLQKNAITTTFVPFAILAMTIVIIDIFFATDNLVIASTRIPLTTFLTSFNDWRILVDTFLLAVFAGVFSVPLYAYIQAFAIEEKRGRIIAVNNILIGTAIILAVILTASLRGLGVSVPTIFLLMGIVNAGVAIYICKLLPDDLIKSFVAWILRLVYRVKVVGLPNYYNASKRTIIVANHVSLLDTTLLTAFIPQRSIMVLNSRVAKKWWIKPFLRLVDAYLIDPENPLSVKGLIDLIQHNRHCIIFPEGRLTVTGALMKIYETPGLIADKTHADILPVRIDGAQYSPFSRLKGKVRIRLFPEITITILAPRKFDVPQSVKGRERRHHISLKLYDLMTDLMFESSDYQQPLFKSLLDAVKVNGRYHKIVEDIQRVPLNYQQLLMRTFILGKYIEKHSDPKEVIGILLPNTIATLVTFLGCHAYGRIPSMLNFTSGEANIINACKTALINIVYTSRVFVETVKLEKVISSLEKQNIHVTYLEDLRGKINIFNKLSGLIKSYFPRTVYQKNCPKISADDAAVILFTSGSEGTPKGVVLSHKNIQANRWQLQSLVSTNNKDVALNSLPMFHVFGLNSATLLPILSGIKTFLYPSPLHYRIVPELVYDNNTTLFFGTDTFLSGYAKHAHPYDFYNVRYIFGGAEKLKDETRRLWSEKFGIRIFEGYGCTEASPVLATNTPMHNKFGTVGRFVPKINYRLEPVPGIQEGGRLFVSGPSIMKGYIFLDEPGVIKPPTDGWHDTGDIVSIDQDGYIKILGRAKRFAKIAGEMIPLANIEEYITEIWPDQLHAAVSIDSEKKGETVVVVTENQNVDSATIQKYYRLHGIANVYFPRHIFSVEFMPLLGNGKIDYVAVKAYVEKKLADQ